MYEKKKSTDSTENYLMQKEELRRRAREISKQAWSQLRRETQEADPIKQAQLVKAYVTGQMMSQRYESKVSNFGNAQSLHGRNGSNAFSHKEYAQSLAVPNYG